MVREPVGLDDLRSLCRLARQCAEIIMDYINKGYALGDIADTFSRIFFDQFSLKLDLRTASKFPRSLHGQAPPNKDLASEQFALAIADAFLKVIVRKLEDEAARGGRGPERPT